MFLDNRLGYTVTTFWWLLDEEVMESLLGNRLCAFVHSFTVQHEPIMHHTLKTTDFAFNSCLVFFILTLVSNCVCLTVFLHQMGWKPSLSSSGQSSARKTSSSGWPVKNTRPLILRRSCCPKPNIFIQFLLNRMPLKRYGMVCLFIIKCNGAEKAQTAPAVLHFL